MAMVFMVIPRFSRAYHRLMVGHSAPRCLSRRYSIQPRFNQLSKFGEERRYIIFFGILNFFILIAACSVETHNTLRWFLLIALWPVPHPLRFRADFRRLSLASKRSSVSISLRNAEFLIDIHDPHTPLIGDQPHKALADVTDFIVLVQELDMFGYGGLDVWIAMWGRVRECDYSTWMFAIPMHLACTQRPKSMNILHLRDVASAQT